MYFVWWKNSSESEEPIVDIGKNKQLPQFTLVDHTLEDCTQNYTAGMTIAIRSSLIKLLLNYCTGKPGRFL